MLTILFSIAGLLYDVASRTIIIIQKLDQEEAIPELFKDLRIFSVFILLCLVGILLSKFMSFHIQLVLENKTTIEGIAHEN